MSIDSQCDKKEVTQEDAEEVTQLMRDFANWIYKALELEYEWRNSDEQVDESILSNEYEFDEEGKRV